MTSTEYDPWDAHPLSASELEAIRWRLEREPNRVFPPQLAQRLIDTLDAERAGWFRDLLAKYMRAVYDEDGSTFVSRLVGRFDEAELAELRAIEDGIDDG